MVPTYQMVESHTRTLARAMPCKDVARPGAVRQLPLARKQGLTRESTEAAQHRATAVEEHTLSDQVPLQLFWPTLHCGFCMDMTPLSSFLGSPPELNSALSNTTLGACLSVSIDDHQQSFLPALLAACRPLCG